MGRTAVLTDKVANPVGPFSIAVHDRDAVYTSGQVAQDAATGRLVDGDVTRQTEQVFKNLEAVLKAGGKTFADVVKTSVFLADMQDFAAMNAVYARHFQAPFPARTTVAVAALPLGAAVEIDVIAR
jgi:2-iminobutanoate/2-iminopropanoate deaminase